MIRNRKRDHYDKCNGNTAVRLGLWTSLECSIGFANKSFYYIKMPLQLRNWSWVRYKYNICKIVLNKICNICAHWEKCELFFWHQNVRNAQQAYITPQNVKLHFIDIVIFKVALFTVFHRFFFVCVLVQ